MSSADWLGSALRAGSEWRGAPSERCKPQTTCPTMFVMGVIVVIIVVIRASLADRAEQSKDHYLEDIQADVAGLVHIWVEALGLEGDGGSRVGVASGELE